MSEDKINEEDKNELLPTEVDIPQEFKDVIGNLPEDKRGIVKGMLVQMMVKESFKGPLPHPKILAGYEKVLPGCASIIIDRMIVQSNHRMSMENRITIEDQKQSGRGQIFGFILALTFLLVAGILIYLGQDTAGGVLATVDLIGLVSIFVLGKYAQRTKD